MNRTFGVIGGDRRQAALASLLREGGRQVCTYGLEEPGDLERAASADVVILPLPLCREPGVLNCSGGTLATAALFRRFRPAQLLLAGQVAPAQRTEAAELGLTLEDYFLREELTVANAAATAEAALQVAMEHLDRTLLDTDCLVLGFGRIGNCSRSGCGAWGSGSRRRPESHRIGPGSGPSAFQRWTPPIWPAGWEALGLCSTLFPLRCWISIFLRNSPGAACAWTWPPSPRRCLRRRGTGAGLGLGPFPARPHGARHRGGGHMGCGGLHIKRTR